MGILMRIWIKTFWICNCFSGEGKSYEEQLKQMLKDLGKEKDKGLEKPLPHMKQVSPGWIR